MFDHLVSNLKQDRPFAQVVAAPNRAPIEKLSQHRAYTFAGTIEEKPEEAEYWLERSTQIVTKQLACSDEHKLECTIVLLANEALSWWETTTLTAPEEKVTWKFFVEEFKKKYISDQYLNDRKTWFLHLKKANKPIEQYVVEFYKYCKYSAEYIKTEKDKCRKFTDGLNDELGPMFTAMEIKDFQILVNWVIATEAKLRAAERRKSGHWSDRKAKLDDMTSWPSEKAKHHHGNSSAYTPASRSKFTPKPQSVNKPSFPVASANSTGSTEKNNPFQYCKKIHWGQCRFQSNLCYACGGSDHYVRDCPQNANKSFARPHVNTSITPSNRNKAPKEAQSGVQGKGKASHSNDRYFEDDDARTRHQSIKGRQTLAEKGFVFNGTSTEGFPPNVMATIAMHKWEKFFAHPGAVEPNQKAINVNMVQEFYAHLTSPTQSSVYVRGEHIQFTAAKINKFYGLQNTADNHSKFVAARQDSANTSVDRDRLNPEGKLWMHFIKQSLMPTSHTATASLNRLQKKGVFESPEDLQKKGRLGITTENIPSLMGFDETAPTKQPLGGARTVAAEKLAALTTMAESTRDQLEKLRTDLRTYFNYVQERDQVIKANFNEMLPQRSLNFPEFPQDLLKPTETKTPEQHLAQPAVEHTTDQPQDKPLGTDSASSSPMPPDATPQHQSPPPKRRKGKEPVTAPVAPAVEVDSEETAALEEEEPQRTPTPPVATTPVRRRTKRTAQRVLVDDSEEEVQSGAGEEDQSTIIPPTHPMSIKRKATKRAKRATTK
ncbi:hypothetical protein GQ457_01G021690 [Hibiscus cannabinus]